MSVNSQSYAIFESLLWNNKINIHKLGYGETFVKVTMDGKP